MRTNLLELQPQVHGRRPSSSKSATDAAHISQDDAGVGSVLSAISPPPSSGRGSKSPASSPALTPTSPRSNSTDKRILAPALSPVASHILQELVGLQKFSSFLVVTLQSYFHLFPQIFLIYLSPNFSIFISCLVLNFFIFLTLHMVHPPHLWPQMTLFGFNSVPENQN